MYPKNADCEWHLIAPLDYYLMLHFNQLDLDTSNTKLCNESDRVSITEVNKALPDQKKQLGMFCGNTIPEDMTSTSNQVTVNLKTGYTTKKLKGFSLSFNAAAEGTS